MSQIPIYNLRKVPWWHRNVSNILTFLDILLEHSIYWTFQMSEHSWNSFSMFLSDSGHCNMAHFICTTVKWIWIKQSWTNTLYIFYAFTGFRDNNADPILCLTVSPAHYLPPSSYNVHVHTYCCTVEQVACSKYCQTSEFAPEYFMCRFQDWCACPESISINISVPPRM